MNIASVVGATGNAGQTNYSAAKAALFGFTKSLAREIGSRGITVNAVAPGFIDTDMTRGLPDAQKAQLIESIALGRLGAAQDIADAVAFLASDKAGYITGQHAACERRHVHELIDAGAGNKPVPVSAKAVELPTPAEAFFRKNTRRTWRTAFFW